jgi:hypothetical protein
LDCIVFHLYNDFRRAVHAARHHGINLEGLRRSPVAGQEFVRDSPEQERIGYDHASPSVVGELRVEGKVEFGENSFDLGRSLTGRLTNIFVGLFVLIMF